MAKEVFLKKRLKNGARILLIKKEKVKNFCLLILTKVGSEYEPKNLNGISHFIEHMSFKGTPKRPKTFEIAKILDEIGAKYNAFTSNEYTGYWIKATSAHLETSIDLLSDLYLNPLFPEKEIEKEKKVVLEEIKMYEDDPKEYIWEVFLKTLYGDQPAGRSILGEKKVIEKLKREDLLNFHQKFYVGKNTLVVLAGDFDEKKALKLLTSRFKTLSSKKPPSKKPPKLKKKPKFTHFSKNTSQAHLILGFPTFSLFDKRKYPLFLLNSILGEGLSSRLWQILREEYSLCYYFSCLADFFTDHGYFAIQAGINLEKVDFGVKLILKELSKIKKEGVLEEELKRAQEKIKSSLIFSLETTQGIASFFGGKLLLENRVPKLSEILKNLEKVSSKKIKTLSQQIFRPENFTFSIIAPKKIKISFNDYLEILK